jgi:ABC-type lipoprotein release transport system permease subunit
MSILSNKTAVGALGAISGVIVGAFIMTALDPQPFGVLHVLGLLVTLYASTFWSRLWTQMTVQQHLVALAAALTVGAVYAVTFFGWPFVPVLLVAVVCFYGIGRYAVQVAGALIG